LIGSRLFALFPQDDERLRKELRSTVRNQYSFATFETSPLGPDSERRYKLRTEYGVVEDNELRRIWGTTRDITDLKRAERAGEASEQRFGDVFEHMRSAVLMLDNSATITFCNDPLVQLAQSSREEMIGTSGPEWIDAPAELDRWKSLLL